MLLVASGPPMGRLRPGRRTCRWKKLPALFPGFSCKPVGRGRIDLLVPDGGISDAARRSGIDKAIFALIIGPLLLPQMLDVRQLRQWVLFPSERHAWAKDWAAVATHLNAVRAPADTLFTWDYMPGVYFTTEMNTPTRLLDAHYIFDSAHSHRRFGKEILRGLEQTPPTFLVDGWNNAAEERLRAGDPLYGKFRDLIDHHYIWIYTAGKFRVYRHQTPGKATAE
jgi:hypothetical protein